jgi:capsular exopolysaccharide synthesis family protein
LLSLPKEPGLTDVIDREITFLHAVQPTGIDNLSILTCGELCDRPASLLESPSMKSLLEEAADHYDLVIVDTPPVSSCADANTLTQYSDGLVMVVRPNFTPTEILVRAGSELTGNGVPILGVVVNGMRTQSEKYYRKPAKGYQPLSKPLKRLTDLGVLNNSARR